MREIIFFLLNLCALYFISIAVFYSVLLLLSWVRMRKINSTVNSKTTGVSFLIPAHNEESLIVETIQTYLSVPQEKEIIIINDGSSDQTLRLLNHMYSLKRMDERTLRSLTHPELKVLDLPHSGKAQALNQGLNIARYPIICTMDADTIPSLEGVQACLYAFAQRDNLLAVGGIIQVMNSDKLKNNLPVEARRNSWINIFQRIEYLRTFICERLAWSLLDSTFLISGAFCMVRKDALIKVGGFNHDSITEDLDLIFRLRKSYPGNHGIEILPVTTCHTQVPNKLRHLMLQRIRWQLGLVQTLLNFKNFIFNSRRGVFGLITIPYLWIVEVASPFFEIIAYIIVPMAWWFEVVPRNTLLTWALLALGYNLVITVLGLILEKRIHRRSPQLKFKMILGSVLIHAGYKQLISWWRLKAMFKVFGRQKSWGEKPRSGLLVED